MTEEGKHLGPIEIGRATIEAEVIGLQALAESIGDTFVAAVELIHACRGRVVVTGVGKSGHIGQKIAATFASTGTPAFFLHAAEAAHGDLGMIGMEDVVVAVSNSGESLELRAVLEYCRRFDVSIVAVTAQFKSTLGRLATISLILPPVAEACPLSLAPMTSTTMTLALGDALAAALMRKRDFSSVDFARYHPGGKLGAQLLKLTEIIDRQPALAQVPMVPPDSSMSEVIIAITDGRRGATAVVDQGSLIGVITDGDLRRSLAAGNFFEKRACDIMTANPRTISGDQIAVEALALCERHKISVLFVTRHTGAISGLVHLQDLLALGIA